VNTVVSLGYFKFPLLLHIAISPSTNVLVVHIQHLEAMNLWLHFDIQHEILITSHICNAGTSSL